ncbi:hypothetical protein AGMMS49593_09760 [Endomicrobiia bacterium]|nr:hypothetical protein AGMMS49593_09760 [Endomicrobiia bacterium]
MKIKKILNYTYAVLLSICFISAQAYASDKFSHFEKALKEQKTTHDFGTRNDQKVAQNKVAAAAVPLGLRDAAKTLEHLEAHTGTTHQKKNTSSNNPPKITSSPSATSPSKGSTGGSNDSSQRNTKVLADNKVVVGSQNPIEFNLFSIKKYDNSTTNNYYGSDKK